MIEGNSGGSTEDGGVGGCSPGGSSEDGGVGGCSIVGGGAVVVYVFIHSPTAFSVDAMAAAAAAICKE